MNPRATLRTEADIKVMDIQRGYVIIDYAGEKYKMKIGDTLTAKVEFKLT